METLDTISRFHHVLMLLLLLLLLLMEADHKASKARGQLGWMASVWQYY